MVPPQGHTNGVEQRRRLALASRAELTLKALHGLQDYPSACSGPLWESSTCIQNSPGLYCGTAHFG